MFDKTFKKLSRVCGEAIYFSFQPLSLAKVPEVLTGRKFVLSFWFLNGKKSEEIKQYPADIVTDGSLPFALWTLPGAVSVMLYDQDASVFWSVLERINDSFVHLRTGTVSIEAGPPNILDYDDAPYSRYIDRVTMVNDPSNKDADSNFDVKTFLYDAISTVPVDSVPTNSVAPAISGTAQVGQVLTASNGTWTNSPTAYSYRWSSGGLTISGATSSTYTIQSSDAGKTISVTVTASNSFGSSGASSAPTAAVTNIPVSAPANTVLPTVSGTAQSGQVLTATTGTWSNSPTGYAYQWQRGTTNISGATSATYTLVSGDVGSTVRVIVTATNSGGSTPATSAAIGTVAAAPVSAPANSVAPTISGTAQVGQALTATSGTWSGSPTYAYQWQRGSTNISGATASTYTVVSGDVGSTLKVIVTATNAGGSVSAGSANTATVIAAPTTSTERSFSYNEYQPGWTLVREETSDPTVLRINNNNGLESASHYMSIMTGTDARATLNHYFKTSIADRKAGLYFEVSVDGGDYVRTAYNDATDDFQLFSGLADVPHLVAVRTPAALFETVYVKKSDNPLKITGSAPSLKLVDQWVQPGQANANVHVGNGLDGFVTGPNNEMLVGGSLVNNPNAVVTPRKVTDYRSGGTPSMVFRANVTELWFVTGQRMVHVWDGTQMFVVDTGKDAAGGQGGNNIRVKRLTGLSGLKTYYVWTSSNGLATYFSVGLVGGTAQPLVEGNRTFDQFGDSITQGVTATAPNTKAENDRGYIETYRVAAKLGYTGCAIGVGGYTVANLNDNIAGWLERKTVTSADVAMIAIGQNNGVPDTSIYNSIIDKLLAKGYGKVICRGVIPAQAGSWAAINTIIEGIVTGRADPRVKYMNVNSWTTITKPDGIHPTVPGYDQMVDLSVAVLPSLLADAGTAVSAPTGFSWDFTNHPVAVAKQSSGKFITSVDPKSKVNSAIWSSTAEYWVVAGKDNSGDGLTEATAVGSIAAAVKKLNDNTSATAGRVRIKSGEYDLSVGVNDAGNALGGGLVYPTKPTAFIGYGSTKPITGPWRKGLAFTLTASGGGVYTVSRSNVGRVLDYSTPDGNGDFVEIPARVDEAAVRAATSGWFVDASGNLLVKRADGVQPTDANTRVYLNAASFAIGTNNVDIYAENIEIHGGDSGVNARVSNTRNVVLVDMVSKYAGSQRPATAGTARPSLGGNAFSFAGFATGSFVGLWRCVAVRSAQDAISSSSNSGSPYYVLTVDCVGRDCGMDGQTSCNGLTQHVNVIGIDLNGEYYRNAGGNLRNIDATQIWALGTYAHDDRGDVSFGGPLNPCDFNLGGTAKAWFQDIRAANSQISLSSDASTTTYLRNATLPNTKIQSGTVSAY